MVVTGAGRGLGLAIAEAVGLRGARVVVAEVDADRAAAAVDRLTAAGVDARSQTTDVAEEASVARLAGSLDADPPLWGLVNNAGLAEGVGGRDFWDIDPADWDRIFAVNTRGAWLVARALAPRLVAARSGRIVNVASDAALYGNPRLAHYVASKGALIALTRAMARDLGPHGVTVNAVAPGLTESPSARHVPAHRHELYARNRALARPQRPGDVAGAVTFLLSDDAAYITGHTLVVDGGFVMC